MLINACITKLELNSRFIVSSHPIFLAEKMNDLIAPNRIFFYYEDVDIGNEFLNIAFLQLCNWLGSKIPYTHQWSNTWYSVFFHANNYLHVESVGIYERSSFGQWIHKIPLTYFLIQGLLFSGRQITEARHAYHYCLRKGTAYMGIMA